MSKQPLATAWEQGSASAFSAPGTKFSATSDANPGHRHSRFRILFGQVYEDAEIEAAAFSQARRVFCIASAGNTALRLAAEHEVIACDINPVQLRYAEARAHGARPQRGDAERAMSSMLKLAPLAGWTEAALRRFIAFDNTEEQIRFWHKHLDTARFRLGCRVLFSRPMLGKIYSKALLDTLPTNFGLVLRRRLERGFMQYSNRTNPYARMLLLGEMLDLPCEHPERIRFVASDAASYLEQCTPRSFDGLSLSNIMDGATLAYKRRLARAVQHAASKQARVVWRSFGEPQQAEAENLAAEDRSMLWGLVRVSPAKEFTGE